MVGDRPRHRRGAQAFGHPALDTTAQHKPAGANAAHILDAAPATADGKRDTAKRHSTNANRDAASSAAAARDAAGSAETASRLAFHRT
ncbi:MAG: hypothetical protein ABUS57_19930 [Pseudomonadota bacterium]